MISRHLAVCSTSPGTATSIRSSGRTYESLTMTVWARAEGPASTLTCRGIRSGQLKLIDVTVCWSHDHLLTACCPPSSQVGMDSNDYLSVFFHVLLPVAYEVGKTDQSASPTSSYCDILSSQVLTTIFPTVYQLTN